MYYLRRRDSSAPWEPLTAAEWSVAGLRPGPNARIVESILAVIGHERLFHPGDLLRAQQIVEDRLGYESEWAWPGGVVTGGANGIDKIAIDVASAMDLPLIVYRPTVPVWGARGGYRERNLKVATLANCCLCIRCSLNPRYGAGWTADQVELQGKPVERVII